jgi:hypothetical protein
MQSITWMRSDATMDEYFDFLDTTTIKAVVGYS